MIVIIVITTLQLMISSNDQNDYRILFLGEQCLFGVILKDWVTSCDNTEHYITTNHNNVDYEVGIRLSHEKNVTLCLFKILYFGGETGVTSPLCREQTWVMIFGGRGLPKLYGITISDNLAAGVAGRFSVLTPNRHRGSIPGFLPRFISIAFSLSRHCRKTSKF